MPDSAQNNGIRWLPVFEKVATALIVTSIIGIFAILMDTRDMNAKLTDLVIRLDRMEEQADAREERADDRNEQITARLREVEKDTSLLQKDTSLLQVQVLEIKKRLENNDG